MGSLLGKLLNATPVPMSGRPSSMVSTFLTTGLGGDAEANLRAYATNGTVYANVSLLASSTAKPDWKLYVKTKGDGRSRYTTNDAGSDQRVERTQHASLNVLNNPATYTANGRLLAAWTRFALFEISGIWLELLGKSAWVVDFGRASFPLGMWPVRPDRITPVPDPDNYLKGYIYTAPDGNEKIPLLPQEVIWNKYPNPLDIYDGLGPTQSVRNEIEGMRYSGEWNRNFFLNSARPDGILSVDHRMEDAEWDELTDRWREAHRGVGRAHRIAAAEGVTWIPTSTSVKDMDFVNLRTDARDGIRESYGMHKVMTGVTDDVNRANAQTGEEVYANWKIVPRLDRWRDVLNYQFLPLFYPSGADIPYEFDYIYPLPANREQDNAELIAKSTAAKNLIGAGYEPHAVLETVGLPDMEVVEQATQVPALPPSWVAAGGAGGGTGDSGDGTAQAVTQALTGPQNAARKLTHAAVGYEHPAQGPQHCGICRHRTATGCQIVQNPIRDEDWCDRFAAKVTAQADPRGRVLAQLATDYPPGAMAWAHHAQWSGPVTLPVSHLQPDMQWLDKADPHHVADFTEQIAAGKKLKPIVAVKTPGAVKPKIVDGHHRYLAAKQAGVPVRAWVATVDSDHGPWETMHNQQVDTGSGSDYTAGHVQALERLLVNGHRPVQLAELRS